MVINIISVILFYRESHKSDNLQVRLRGTLLLAAMLLLAIGGFLHIIIGNAFLILVIFILSSLCFYTALVTPEWMKKRLSKERE